MNKTPEYSTIKVYKEEDFSEKERLGSGMESTVYDHPEENFSNCLLKVRKKLSFLNIDHYLGKMFLFPLGKKMEARTSFYGLKIIEALFPGSIPEVLYIAGENYENTCVEKVNLGKLPSSQGKWTPPTDPEIIKLENEKYEAIANFKKELKKFGIYIDTNPNNFTDDMVYVDQFVFINCLKFKNVLKFRKDLFNEKQLEEVSKLLSYYKYGTLTSVFKRKLMSVFTKEN